MSSRVWGNNKTEFFDKLTPDKVLDAIELSGFKTTGRVLTLASMENRVFEVEVEGFESDNISDSFKIIKFYRPGRWSEKQIQDEHDFLFDLVANDIFVIAPIKIEGQSVFTNTDGLFYSIFPKKGGRACDEWTDLLLEQMGRLLARLHNTGQASIAQHRLKLDIQNFGENNLELILNSEYLPLEYKKSYESVCKTIFE
ncbi:MAG: phosphotransferase, partial [Halobacteriovoraceae bacterium]|nr:phosphotransferase [Halobacteriovoraceae bacterium]